MDVSEGPELSATGLRVSLVLIEALSMCHDPQVRTTNFVRIYDSWRLSIARCGAMIFNVPKFDPIPVNAATKTSLGCCFLFPCAIQRRPRP
jgi:hypothetical protein